MLAETDESTVIIPLDESIVIPAIVGESEKLKVPAPFVSAVVPPEALKPTDDLAIPLVVMMLDPPLTVTPVLTRTVIVVEALAETVSDTVTVSV